VLLHEEAGRVCYRAWAKKLAPLATVLLRSNSAQSHFAAVEAGEAMAALPRVLADRRPTLRRIATPLAEPVQAIRMGFHADMRDSPRLRAFIDFAVEEFELQAGALNPPP
jgi:DNA-binding transcriptional LysR family regulator